MKTNNDESIWANSCLCYFVMPYLPLSIAIASFIELRISLYRIKRNAPTKRRSEKNRRVQSTQQQQHQCKYRIVQNIVCANARERNLGAKIFDTNESINFYTSRMSLEMEIICGSHTQQSPTNLVLVAHVESPHVEIEN